ncbi:CAAX amino terminal protease self- immunity [Pedobacter glucosidilyticus]|uniref:CPBP family intramembrane metalloprotease n=2 Tax=Pedobacter aquae TaxID=2605747 RepID=A0A5C0VLR1_9SPHI|nr:CAAX amino terminal protease self- immunity [Pedobacter glucosidilyticus]QEK52613.1 CPBP family intramembrane metalloprotease [Pedobacter aquae]
MSDMQKSTHQHPALQLIYLLLYVIAGGLVFSVIGIIIYSLTGNNCSILLTGDESNMDINFIRTIQISSSLGIFIAGPLTFALATKQPIKSYYHFYNPLKTPQLLIIVTAIMVLGLPFLELINAANQKMVLPDFLKGLEQWMREKEQQAAVLTKQLLVMKSFSDYLFNLLMIAVIPAIGEELLFRGSLQNIFYKWFYNPHVAIWISAIIFSAIHVQFFGFFPRMLLGVLFGYFLWWGKSLWLAIWAHFLNNGLAVTMAYVLQLQGKSIDEIERTDTFQIWGYLLSAIITLVLFIKFYQDSKKNNQIDIYE